uniref:Immunoglobulin V-set domain-containing protein n=1 Tax=Salarias fasciatus TaxID=181472 RepID=A0A672H9D9_SALFA
KGPFAVFSSLFFFLFFLATSAPQRHVPPCNCVPCVTLVTIDNYDRILWYKQSQGELQLLGYIAFTDGNPEPGLDVKMHGDANKNKNSTLTMEKLQVNSSAVYFCAASYHSAPHHCSSVLKPPHQTSNIHSHLELTS